MSVHDVRLAQDENGDTLFHRLARKGELWTTNEPIPASFLTIRNKARDTIVHEAALNGELSFLIANIGPKLESPDTPARFERRHLDSPDADGFTPVHFAAMYGHLDQLAAADLLDTDALLTTDFKGRTPLWHAVARGHGDSAFEILGTLLTRRQPGTRDHSQGQHAISTRRTADILPALTEKVLTTPLPDGSVLLHALAEHGLACAAALLTKETLQIPRHQDGLSVYQVALMNDRAKDIPLELLP